MNRKTIGLVSLIVLLIAGIIGFLWFYNSYYLPGKRIENTYIEVYQDVDPSDIGTIWIDTIDHKVVIKPSDDEKVKISYFQKIDNSNSFTISNHTVRLWMIEKAEDLENIFYQNSRPIDTITIYIPQGSYLSFKNDTVGGSLTVRDVRLKDLQAGSVGGPVVLENAEINHIKLDINYGGITVTNCQFQMMDINAVTGECRVSLPDSLSLYNLNLHTSYGTLSVNNERVHEIINETDVIVNRLERNVGAEKNIIISSVRSIINVTTVEVYEEPPVDNPEENPEQNTDENKEKGSQ